MVDYNSNRTKDLELVRNQLRLPANDRWNQEKPVDDRLRDRKPARTTELLFIATFCALYLAFALGLIGLALALVIPWLGR